MPARVTATQLMTIVVVVAPDVATPVGAGSGVPPPLPPLRWSTIAFSAATWVPALRAKSLPYQPTQSQQPFGLGRLPLAAVGRLTLSTLACGNSTTMRLVSAQRL